MVPEGQGENLGVEGTQRQYPIYVGYVAQLREDADVRKRHLAMAAVDDVQHPLHAPRAHEALARGAPLGPGQPERVHARRPGAEPGLVVGLLAGLYKCVVRLLRRHVPRTAERRVPVVDARFILRRSRSVSEAPIKCTRGVQLLRMSAGPRCISPRVSRLAGAKRGGSIAGDPRAVGS